MTNFIDICQKWISGWYPAWQHSLKICCFIYCSLHADIVSIGSLVFSNVSASETSGYAGQLYCSKTLQCRNVVMDRVTVVPAEPGHSNVFDCTQAYGKAVNVTPQSCVEPQPWLQKFIMMVHVYVLSLLYYNSTSNVAVQWVLSWPFTLSDLEAGWCKRMLHLPVASCPGRFYTWLKVLCHTKFAKTYKSSVVHENLHSCPLCTWHHRHCVYHSQHK